MLAYTVRTPGVLDGDTSTYVAHLSFRATMLMYVSDHGSSICVCQYRYVLPYPAVHVRESTARPSEAPSQALRREGSRCVRNL